MEIKVFTDVIDALEKVCKAVIAITEIPKSQRQKIVLAVEESFTLLNSAINLVIHRLGDLLLEDSKELFIKDLRRLDNHHEWSDLEREMRLCRRLREVHSEIDSFTLRTMPLRMGSKDWKNVRVLVDEILEREGELASFISRKLSALSDLAKEAKSSDDGYKKTVRTIKRVRTRLRRERQRLIEAELTFLESIKSKM
jgi:hypothetical protein